MGITTGKAFGLGVARAHVMELNTAGSPKAVGTAAYYGVEVVGVQDLTLTIPDPQKKTHLGNNQPLQVDFLPPTEAISGSMKCSEMDQILYALLTGTKRRTLAEGTMVGLGTNMQGFEPQVALLVTQQALDEAGNRNWITAICPKCVMYPHQGNMDANPTVHSFDIAPAFVMAHLWGVLFTMLAEGYTRSQVSMWQTQHPLGVCSWLPGVQVPGYLCAFGADKLASAAAKVAMFKNEALMTVTTDYTVSVGLDSIALVAAPGATDRYTCFYEYPEPA